MLNFLNKLKHIVYLIVLCIFTLNLPLVQTLKNLKRFFKRNKDVYSCFTGQNGPGVWCIFAVVPKGFLWPARHFKSREGTGGEVKK